MNPQDPMDARYLNALDDLMQQEKEQAMKKDEPMPEFEDGDAAYEWMQRRLNKSWVDEILDNPDVAVVDPLPDVTNIYGNTPRKAMTPEEFYKALGINPDGSSADDSA
jgi:hypothetical protein